MYGAWWSAFVKCTLLIIGIPDKPDLAETYYSQFEDFEQAAEEAEEEEDMEGTMVSIGTGANQEEVEDLINCMQNALDKSDTSKYLISCMQNPLNKSHTNKYLVNMHE